MFGGRGGALWVLPTCMRYQARWTASPIKTVCATALDTVAARSPQPLPRASEVEPPPPPSDELEEPMTPKFGRDDAFLVAELGEGRSGFTGGNTYPRWGVWDSMGGEPDQVLPLGEAGRGCSRSRNHRYRWFR